MEYARRIRPRRNGWKSAYGAAIGERNVIAIRRRVADAEEAIDARRRELSTESGVEAEVEMEDMDDAWYALEALRSAEEHTGHVA